MTYLEDYIGGLERRRSRGLLLGILAIAAVICVAVFLVYYLSIPPAQRVAVIPIEGQLYTGDTMEGGYAGSVAIGRKMRSAADDPFVQAIVLRVNSPGGSPAAAQEIISDLKYARGKKPVVVSMGDYATSGAYYVCAYADRIFANPDTLTGGVGTIWVFTDISGWMKKEGYNVTVVKSGEKKDMTYPYRPLTPEESELAQEMVDRSAERLISDIVAERGVSRELLQDGRLIRGEEAKEAGLVDEIGNLNDAIEGALALARRIRS